VGGGDSVGSSGNFTKLFEGQTLSAEEYALLQELKSRERTEKQHQRPDDAALMQEMDDDEDEEDEEDDEEEIERMAPIGGSLDDAQSPIKGGEEEDDDEDVKELQLLLQ